MEKEKNNVQQLPPVLLIHEMLMLVALVICCFNIFGENILGTFGRISECFFGLALIAGLIYFFMDYGKQGSLFYKIFMGLYLIGTFVAVLGSFFNSIYTYSWLQVISNLVALIFITILTIGKDLGRVISYILIGIIFVLQIACLIEMLSVGAFNLVGNLTRFVDAMLALSALIMVVGKFADKKKRGRI